MKSEKQLFQCASAIEKVETRSDGTLKLTIGTQDLVPDEEAKLMRLRRKQGWFMFAEIPIEDVDLSDIPDFIPRPKGEKSLSQKERDIMFVYWKEKTDQKIPFEEWREKIIEKRIEGWKQKINE
jgi:hypothetical protein